MGRRHDGGKVLEIFVAQQLNFVDRVANKKDLRPAFIGGISDLSRFVSKSGRHAQANCDHVTNSEPNCDCRRCGSQITASTYSGEAAIPPSPSWYDPCENAGIS